MEKSPSIVNLAKALKVFHASMGKIKKDNTNPFFNSKYANLSTILEAIKQPLQDAGLSFAQFPTGQHGLTTVLMHTESGEFMQCDYFMQPVKTDPQAIGSMITYARRYALAAVLGLNLDEDDDGNAATHGASKPKQPGEKPWLNMNTPEYAEVVERLKNQSTTIYGVMQAYKLNKDVKAELQEISDSLIPDAQAVHDAKVAAAAEKPWLDMSSKKYALVVEKLRNKTTTISQVAQFFKLNKEVRAELQAIVSDSIGSQPQPATQSNNNRPVDTPAPAPAESAPAEKQPLEKGSKKYDLIVERLKNQTTNLGEVAKFFILTKEVRESLIAVVNEALIKENTAINAAQS